MGTWATTCLSRYLCLRVLIEKNMGIKGPADMIVKNDTQGSLMFDAPC